MKSAKDLQMDAQMRMDEGLMIAHGCESGQQEMPMARIGHSDTYHFQMPPVMPMSKEE